MKIEDFGPFTLSESAHASPAEGMCVMEMVSFLAGEDWSDSPQCTSPVIASFCREINDEMGQSVRDRLQGYVPRLIGTISPAHERERTEYLAWAAIRVFAPNALRQAGLSDLALKLEGQRGTLADAAAVAKYTAAKSSYARDAVAFAAAKYSYAAAVYAAESSYAADAYAADAADAAAVAAAKAAKYSYAADAAIAAADAAIVVADAVAVFDVLDGLLEIGPSGGDLLPEQAARIEPLRQEVAG